MRTFSPLFLLATLALLGGTAHSSSAQGFFDDFEDNNLTDGNPVTWASTPLDAGDVFAADGDMVLAPGVGGRFTWASTDAQHQNARVESIFEAPTAENIFLFTYLRVVAGEPFSGYWGGLFPDGELGLGYTNPDSTNMIVERGVYLPSGAVAPGDDITMQFEVVGNELTVNAWETQLGPNARATLSWTDPLNRFPTGDLIFPFVNFNGNPESVRLRSLRLTEVSPDAPLSLEVNAITGEVTLLSGDTGEVTINAYEITSPVGAIVADQWKSLASLGRDAVDGPADEDTIAGNSPGETWQTVISTPESIIEAFLFGTSVFDSSTSISLGNLFDTEFDPQLEPLQFSYTTSTGSNRVGEVVYVRDLPGDFNRDGSVNGADFLAWQRGESPNPLGLGDLADWQAHYGDVTRSSALSPIPEPSSTATMIAAILLLLAVPDHIRTARNSHVA